MDITPFPSVPTPTASPQDITNSTTKGWGVLDQATHWLNARTNGKLPQTPTAIILHDSNDAPVPIYPHQSWSIIISDTVTVAPIDVPESKIYPHTTTPCHHTLNSSQVEELIHQGKTILKNYHEPLLIAGVHTPGITNICLAALAHLCYIEPVKAVGFPSNGTSDDQWIKDIHNIRDLMYQLRSAGGNARTVLEKLGSPAIAALSGLYGYAAGKKIPIIISDLPSLTAAIMAEDLASGSRHWYLIGTSSPYPVYTHGVTQLFSTINLPLKLHLHSPDAGIFFYNSLRLILQ